MFFIYSVLIFIAVQSGLAFGSDLCIQGCCGLSLKFPAKGLSLSDENGASVPLLGFELPCCACDNTPVFKQQATHKSVWSVNVSEEDSTNFGRSNLCTGQIPLPSVEEKHPIAAFRPNCNSSVPFNMSAGWCPCLDCNCDYARHCQCGNRLRKEPPKAIILQLLQIIATEANRPEAKVCDPGACKDNCLCRETALYNVKEALFPDGKDDSKE